MLRPACCPPVFVILPLQLVVRLKSNHPIFSRHLLTLLSVNDASANVRLALARIKIRAYELVVQMRTEPDPTSCCTGRLLFFLLPLPCDPQSLPIIRAYMYHSRTLTARKP